MDWRHIFRKRAVRSVFEIDNEVLVDFIDVGDLMLVAIFLVLVTEI